MLQIALMVLCVLNFTVYKKKDGQLLSEFEVYAVRAPAILILYLFTYIIDSSLYFFIQKKIEDSRMTRRDLKRSEKFNIVFILIFMVLTCIYSIAVTVLCIVDIIYRNEFIEKDKFEPNLT